MGATTVFEDPDVGELREELLDILVQVEASIDFPEEEIELLQRHHLIDKINLLVTKIKAISDTYDWGRLFREGAKVCICGRPNVGKSSLLNALLGTDRVIVSPIPGTTRDVIEESLNLDGLPVTIWDTAGIRESLDQVEQIGVALSRQYLEQADALVVVIDGSTDLTSEDWALLQIALSKKAVIGVNKSDLPAVVQLRSLATDNATRLATISAKTGIGIDSLKKTLRELIEAPDEPGCDFTGLLEAVHQVDGVERIRFASPHPRYVTPRFLDAIHRLPRICRHLHLPVQSGWDRILALMKRGHSVLEYKSKIRRLREVRPDISVTTDIIVGFPGETETDFAATLSLMEEMNFDTSFSFLYSARPGTPVAELADDTPREIKEARLARLHNRNLEMAAAISRSMVGTAQG